MYTMYKPHIANKTGDTELVYLIEDPTPVSLTEFVEITLASGLKHLMGNKNYLRFYGKESKSDRNKIVIRLHNIFYTRVKDETRYVVYSYGTAEERTEYPQDNIGNVFPVVRIGNPETELVVEQIEKVENKSNS
ncbi:MAG: hypothetical protein R6U44_04730 [Archaeoglobaceae archaeon]